MGWQSLKLYTTGEKAILLNEVLIAQGALSVSIENGSQAQGKQQTVLAEFGEPVNRFWPQSMVQALFPDTADIPTIMDKINLVLPGEPWVEYSVEHVHDKNWVQAYRESCHPVKISCRLWVVPSWEQPPDPEATNVILDPGLAFGSGTHPSTKLCLSWLSENTKGGELVIDYGCGSGVLGIAALKLGAGEAWGVDTDEQALMASRENAQRNRVEFPVYQPEKVLEGKADIVVANILAKTLEEVAPTLAGLVKPQGHIVLSGITANQADTLCSVYRQWFKITEYRKEGEWVCLAGAGNQVNPGSRP